LIIRPARSVGIVHSAARAAISGQNERFRSHGIRASASHRSNLFEHLVDAGVDDRPD
jgi:hypothetical protein